MPIFRLLRDWKYYAIRPSSYVSIKVGIFQTFYDCFVEYKHQFYGNKYFFTKKGYWFPLRIFKENPKIAPVSIQIFFLTKETAAFQPASSF